VDEPLFISSFRSFRRVPTAALFAVLLFVVVEFAIAMIWRPDVIGIRRYSTLSLSYDYGYASDIPRLFREGASLHYHPTEYVDMRPFAIDERKPAREIRIFTFGTSVTRAGGLPLGTAYPELLELMLNERHSEYDWHVVNLAAAGIGTTRIMNVLLNMVPYDPDVIIVHPHGSNEYEDERDARLREQLYSGLNGLFLRSRLVVYLKKFEAERFGSQDDQGEPGNAEHLAGLDPENTERWMATMEANMRRIDGVTRELELPSIYIGRAERDAELFSDERIERLNSPISAQPHYLDVAAAFAGAVNEYSNSDLFQNLTHYSEVGHQIVARELYEMIRPGGPLFEQISAHRKAHAMWLEGRTP
jgi:hypothetical protein